MNAFATRLGLSILVTLLAMTNGFAAINKLPEIPNTDQTTTTIRSFHETTEMAETLWAELTTRFIQQYENGNYQVALDIAQRAYNLADTYFGIEDVNTADSLLKLGIINQTLGNLTKAEDYLLGALVILEDRLSPDHPDTAVVLTNLGNIYFELNDMSNAEKYHKRALLIRENAFGENDSSVAQSNYNLAVLYERTKDYKQAELLYQKAIAVWTKVYGPLHPYVGNTLTNLANTYIAESKFSEAIAILQRSVAYNKSIYGAQHQEVAQSLINLGNLYLEQGQYDIAGGAYKEALNIAEQVLKPSDPQLALLLYTLANVYHLQARMTDPDMNAMELEQSAANMPVKSVDEANRTDWLNKKAATDEMAKRNPPQTAVLFARALPLYQRAAAILDTDVSKNEPALQVVLSELALLYKAIGNNEMALATESRISQSH